MDAASFFERQAPRALDEARPLFTLGLTYAIEVTRDGGESDAWTLDLGSEPAVRRGAAAAADCRLSLCGADFAEMLRSPRESRHLFYRGRIRISGSLQAAAHLPGLLTLLGASRLPGGLGALLGEVPVRRFLDEHWPERCLAVHGPLDRLGLAGLPGLGSAEELLERWPGRVRLGDRRGGRLVGAAEAARLLEGGEHIAFSDVEHVVPELGAWLERLRLELDLPLPCHGRCLVYASPGAAGEVLHFDQNANFVIQLAGEKAWEVAPNRHVSRPTARYTSLAPPDPELALYASLPLPAELPPEAETVHLRPGSLLFLPRGYWHRTGARGGSLSLNFTFDQPCWADLVPGDARATLLRDDRWRALATGAAAPRRRAAAAAEARLRALLADQAAGIAGLDAAGVLGRLLPAQSVDPTEVGTPELPAGAARGRA